MGYGMMNYAGQGYGSSGFGLFHVGFNLLFYVLLIAGVYFLVRWLMESFAGSVSSSPSGTAIEIVKQRYARGEISREEFEVIKRDLA